MPACSTRGCACVCAKMKLSVSWSGNDSSRHEVPFGHTPVDGSVQPCTGPCVRGGTQFVLVVASPHERREIPLRCVERLAAGAESCEVTVLRLASDDPPATYRPEALYVLLIAPRAPKGAPLRAVWGCGPPMVFNVMREMDMRAADMFPLSLPRGDALKALCKTLGVDTDALGESVHTSWLDVERFD